MIGGCCSRCMMRAWRRCISECRSLTSRFTSCKHKTTRLRRSGAHAHRLNRHCGTLRPSPMAVGQPAGFSGPYHSLGASRAAVACGGRRRGRARARTRGGQALLPIGIPAMPRRRVRARARMCKAYESACGYICTMRERRSSNSDSIWSSSRFFSCAPLPLTTLCTEIDSPKSALPVALPTMSAWRRCACASVVLEPHRDACAVDRTERTGRTSIMRVWFADDSLSVALSPSVADNPPLPNTSNPAAAHVGLSVP